MSNKEQKASREISTSQAGFVEVADFLASDSRRQLSRFLPERAPRFAQHGFLLVSLVSPPPGSPPCSNEKADIEQHNAYKDKRHCPLFRSGQILETLFTELLAKLVAGDREVKTETTRIPEILLTFTLTLTAPVVFLNRPNPTQRAFPSARIHD